MDRFPTRAQDQTFESLALVYDTVSVERVDPVVGGLYRAAGRDSEGVERHVVFVYPDGRTSDQVRSLAA